MLPHASLSDIPPDVAEVIAARLEQIERTNSVRILLAVESGSRAWGFASPDSDFDVRFLYVRRVEDYAALFEPRDVIECPMDGALDINGWDLRKALGLGLKWNPALVEWLTSPITYRETGWEAAALRALFVVGQSRESLVRHYHGLAFRQFARFIDGRSSVMLKKYFYVLRPAVALLWLERRPTEVPPMSLPALLDGLDLPTPLGNAIVDLRQRKSLTTEFGQGDRIAVLDAFCEERLAWGRAHLPASQAENGESLKHRASAVFHASVFGCGAPAVV